MTMVLAPDKKAKAAWEAARKAEQDGGAVADGSGA
jgi:hypothetical protein